MNRSYGTRSHGSRKPARFDELVRAHIDGDSNLVAEIEAEIHAAAGLVYRRPYPEIER